MTPPLPHQNPPPIPAETVRPGTPDMAQICAMLAAMGASIREGMEANTSRMNENMNAKMEGMKNEINGMSKNMDGNTRKMEAMAQTMREEMQCMGAGLQGGLEKLKIGNGELLRATCWGRLVEVTETVTETLKGEETTCTRETVVSVREMPWLY